MQVPNPWGHNNKDLLTMYQGATAGGECPLVVDSFNVLDLFRPMFANVLLRKQHLAQPVLARCLLVRTGDRTVVKELDSAVHAAEITQRSIRVGRLGRIQFVAQLKKRQHPFLFFIVLDHGPQLNVSYSGSRRLAMRT